MRSVAYELRPVTSKSRSVAVQGAVGRVRTATRHFQIAIRRRARRGRSRTNCDPSLPNRDPSRARRGRSRTNCDPSLPNRDPSRARRGRSRTNCVSYLSKGGLRRKRPSGESPNVLDGVREAIRRLRDVDLYHLGWDSERMNREPRRTKRGRKAPCAVGVDAGGR
jgi:hypothetical protein